MAHFSKRRYLKLAKGFFGQSRNCVRSMIPKVHKALAYSYVGRKLRKRNLRRDWIRVINSGVKEHSVRYNSFMCGLNNSNIKLDRKILSQLVVTEPYSFKAIVDEVKLQGNIQDIKQPNRITLLEAYCRDLIIDLPLKQSHADRDLRAQAEKNSLPYFFGQRAQLQQTIKEGIEKQAEISKQIENLHKK